MAAQLMSPGCDLRTRKGTDSRTMAGVAGSDLSLCSGLLAAESVAGRSEREGFRARTQQETCQREVSLQAERL